MTKPTLDPAYIFAVSRGASGGGARFSCGFLATAKHAVTLDRGEPSPDPVGRTGFEGVLEAFLTHRARRADRLRFGRLRIRRREEHRRVGVATRGVIEPISTHGDSLQTRHSRTFNARRGRAIPAYAYQLPPRSGRWYPSTR
jgi:hypothetical protein